MLATELSPTCRRTHVIVYVGSLLVTVIVNAPADPLNGLPLLLIVV
jgi:hypothetical protein